MLKEGQKAPNFKLLDQNGKEISLNLFKGKNVILYFYPKDNTSGCTKEACNFRNEFPRFSKLNAVILGVSPDSVASHKKFIEKYDLPFSLLSDEKKGTLIKYGVWQEKSLYGKKYMGVVRTTFIIDPLGKIKKIFHKVNVDNHNQEVFEAIEN
ncbi:MAG: thioredoxin-dependent thiol peroxidase [Ignavibacteriaceae bacterium]|nr:thioredoxin-dependent thiol peroxidase [Ignavibacteriaceae bacterium]